MVTPKILIVEDDISILKLYERKFVQKGFEVVLAEDGPSAVEKTKSELPNIILLDLMLPEMNGLEVLQKIKKDKNTKKIPVVVLTNYGELDNVTESFLQGAVECLIKVEHTPEEVVELVMDVLESKKNVLSKAFKNQPKK